jgi:ATPase subunit of ABC transporter with duplicated ATPase domains
MLVGRDATELEAFLRENLGFDDDTLPRPLSSLSGGWRMKLALTRSGGKVLWYITHIFLLLGKKYGLLGHSGAGKMTLLRSITNDKIEGMPAELVSIFLESNFDDEQSITSPPPCSASS